MIQGKTELENNALRENEVEWLETMLSPVIPYKKELISQINCAQVTREYTKYYLSLLFKVEQSAPQVICNVRVSVEMVVYKKGMMPIQFLLHVIDGYIVELEIFAADSSEISSDLSLDDATMEVNITWRE